MMEDDLRLRVALAPVVREAAHRTTPLRPTTLLVVVTSKATTPSSLTPYSSTLENAGLVEGFRECRLGKRTFGD
jgi:hypothetical protein